ncbi:sensor histidine kinase [Corynebacterium tuberculostearicum]|uniref:sensor histidine kinase n=1 Tax=Corynebacterium TaxID=1716 RepID=UPI001EF2BC84|nr:MULTISPECIES: histidine kinase [Corynebacterium]MCG7441769.1 histidine kinase [Corynebacterium sp. ACRPQ]MCG7465805.1 histidine kinase [Corynebacterium sp. ACRPJ]WKE52372.1 sensor histidine kinase [Corynebacterium tuberculostearicum]
MIRTKWSTAGIVAACAVANWLIGVALMSFDIEEYSPSFEEYGPYICTGFAVGVVTIIALPFALEHQPRELSDVDYAGSTRSFIAGCIVLLGSSSYFGAASGVVAFISMVSRRSTLRSVAAVACFVVAFAVETSFNPYMAWDDIGWVGAIFVVVVMVAGLLVGQKRGNLREKRWRVEQQARMNREEMRARVERARQEERENIARDMHDSLSHRLSLVAIHAGALSYPREGVPDEFTDAARTIRTEAQNAVEDLRTVLSALREDLSEDPRTTLEELVAAAREAGAEVTVTYADGASPDVFTGLSTMAQHAVHRAVQEGLTNARKHAAGQPVSITVREVAGEVGIEMRNPLSAAKAGDRAGASAGGYGLVGLRERVELSGGRMNVHVGEEGEEFSWSILLPLAHKEATQ